MLNWLLRGSLLPRLYGGNMRWLVHPEPAPRAECVVAYLAAHPRLRRYARVLRGAPTGFESTPFC
ncbi:MAG: hypothetical protein WKG07_10710 [Hymenobacter sp.]